MTIIDINDALAHTRVDASDIIKVRQCLAAAEDAAAQFLNRRFFRDQASLDVAIEAGAARDCDIVITPSITAACLLIAGHLYDHRESVIVGTGAVEMPMGAHSLLYPYRIGIGV